MSVNKAHLARENQTLSSGSQNLTESQSKIEWRPTGQRDRQCRDVVVINIPDSFGLIDRVVDGTTEWLSYRGEDSLGVALFEITMDSATNELRIELWHPRVLGGAVRNPASACSATWSYDKSGSAQSITASIAEALQTWTTYCSAEGPGAVPPSVQTPWKVQSQQPSV